VTLTLDWVGIPSCITTYIPNFIGIGKTFCGRTDGHLRPTLLGRLFGVDLKIALLVSDLPIQSAQSQSDAIQTTVHVHIHSTKAHLQLKSLYSANNNIAIYSTARNITEQQETMQI